MTNASLLINQGTNAAINFDANNGTNTQVVAVGYGTVSTVGTLPNLPGGTLNNLASGTINAATVVLNSGTINVGTFVASGGTIQAATVSSLPNLPGGTLNNLASGTINAATAVLNNGTINVGTFVMPSGTLTVLPNLPQGSIQVTAGTMIQTVGTVNTGTINVATITEGTLRNLISGTINSATAVLNSGTINVGTFAQLSGTQNVGTLNTGTINTGTFVMTSGTLNVGTATVRIDPLPVVDTISHAGTSGTTAIGTLVAAATFGAGTAGYITNFRIIAISGTPEVILAFGSVTNGNQVIHHGLYPAGGGIANTIPYPHGYGTTNSPITYQILSGAGTVSWDVDYFPHT